MRTRRAIALALIVSCGVVDELDAQLRAVFAPD
jgi:hypothetical protein